MAVPGLHLLVVAVHFFTIVAEPKIGHSVNGNLRPVMLDTTQIIADIKKEYEVINTDKKQFKIFEKDVMDESTEGGFITAYRDGQGFRKITATYFGETGKTVEEYYFHQNDLFFVFTLRYSYNKPISEQGSKIESVQQDRYYFYKKSLFKWLDNKKTKDYGSGQFAKRGVELIRDAEGLRSSFVACKGKGLKISKSDTLGCKYGAECPSTRFIIKGSRNSCGEVIHVMPVNKKVGLE